MTDTEDHLVAAARRLRRPLRLTRLGMAGERALRAFWPLLTLATAAAAALMLGAQDALPLPLVRAAAAAALLSGLWLLWRGARAFRWPGEAEAVERLDRSLPGRPIAAITDIQAVGAGDAGSEGVWAAHVARMAERTRLARTVRPDLRLAPRDPYALRYAALLALAVALLFGSIWRTASVGGIGPGGTGAALAAGPAWEGWIEPPAHTGRPVLYLNEIDRPAIEVPEGSRVTLRLYGQAGALTVAEDVSGAEAAPAADAMALDFAVAQAGTLAIEGPGGRSWRLDVLADTAPVIATRGPMEPVSGGEFRQPFTASDDYGVRAGRATIALDLARVDRRYGLAAEPEPRPGIALDLPMPITGDRAAFDETLIDNLALHPWAGLPVTVTLDAEDDAGQTGRSAPLATVLPGRRFFDPLAAAIVEGRQALLWSRSNAAGVASVLRAVSHRPDEVFDSETAYLKLRVALRRLEATARHGAVSDEVQEEIAQALWDVALLIEEGDLSDALERLRRAQERLEQAMRDGASDEEIAELMQELREAMADYMRQLAEQTDPSEMPEMSETDQAMTSDQMEEMLERLQELMEQGRMEEAQRLLDQLRQMMENMQIARGQQGEGQQAMEGLAETLREQQGLSDEAFRDLQEQFGQPGQQPGQQQGQGRGQQQGQGQQPGQQPGQGQEPGEGMSLADRQEALRRELESQRQGLPGAGSEGGDAARDALDRAGRAMDDAERNLRDEDFAGALDSQSEAIEALREGMRELGEEMAREQGGQPGEGDQRGMADGRAQRDPLGREAGRDGRLGTDESLLQGEDVYRRARDLLDEIRRRSAEQGRPDAELDYLKRLLDRF